MVSLADSLVSSSARKMPIRVRPDLSARRHQYLGRSYWIVKDPVGLKYYRFQDEEYAILNMFDGTRSLDDIKDEFEAEFPPQKITLEEIQNFIGMLHQSGLILAGVANQGHELLKRRTKRRRQEIIGAMSNILCIKFKGLDLDWLLAAMIPYVRWMYHPITVTFCFLLCFSALALVLVEFEYFRSKLPGFHTFFGPSNLILLSLTLGLTKVVHEFGHGLTAKYYGGECHEMGVMILVLTPCLYCNVSDSWMLPNKWHRIAIGAAGVYVECVLAAICTFIWWNTVPGLVNYLALNVMFISSVSTIIFNVNPLLRYDGYYILADWIEIPNLRQKATKILTRKCSEFFLGMEQQDDPFLPKKNQFLFAIYTIAAVCYRWVVMASILYFVYTLFKRYSLEVVGQAIAAMSLYGLLIMPLWKIAKFFWVPGRIYKVKKARFYASLFSVFAIIGFVIFVPLPYSVFVPMHIELRNDSSSARVYVPSVGGKLISVSAKAGQKVQAGDVLAELENIDLSLNVVKAQGEVSRLIKEISIIEEIRNRSGEYGNEAGAKILTLEESLASAKKQLAALMKDYERLLLVAPIDGIVVSPDWRPNRQLPGGRLPSWHGTPLQKYNLQTFLEPSTLLCSIGDPKRLEAVLIVGENRVPFIELGNNVQMILEEYPSIRLFGTVFEKESRKMQSVPTQMTTEAGGEIPTKAEEDGTKSPAAASYRVSVLLDNPDEMIRVGMTGRAKIQVRPKTLSQRLMLLVNELFTFKL